MVSNQKSWHLTLERLVSIAETAEQIAFMQSVEPEFFKEEWRAGLLCEAVSSGKIEIVRSLLAHGVSPDGVAENQPIFSALSSMTSRGTGNLGCLRCLLLAGANPDLRSLAGGWTPLGCALFNKAHAQIALLCYFGADPFIATGLEPDDLPAIEYARVSDVFAFNIIREFLAWPDEFRRARAF